MHCRILSGISGLYPLDASSTPGHSHETSPEIGKCFLGSKVALSRKPLSESLLGWESWLPEGERIYTAAFLFPLRGPRGLLYLEALSCSSYLNGMVAWGPPTAPRILALEAV